MLRKYMMPNGRKYQFEEAEAPACAIPVDAIPQKTAKPETKVAKPANKARKAEKK